jgi:hypothetical protein
MTDAAKLLLTAVLAVALAGALLGPPPAAPHRRPAAALAVAGCSVYVLALLVALGGHGGLGTALVGPGVAMLALAGWLARGSSGGGDDGGDDGDDAPEPRIPPVDWDEFDRLRGEWEHSRPRVPALS